jgi:predicted dehydrogenase
VYCSSFRPLWSGFAGPTAAHAIFEMTGGVRVAVNANWSADGFQTSWTGSWRAVGEHGTAVWDGESAPRVESGPGTTITAAPVAQTVQRPDRFFGLEPALAEFVAALRTGTLPQGECHDNILSLAMCHAAAESGRTKAPVPITA